MSLRRRLDRHSERGQSMTEFALIAPLFFLMLFAVIQLGFLLGGQIAISNAVRETARYAATVPTATAAQVLTELTTRQLPKAVPGFLASNVVVGPTATRVDYCSYPNPNNAAGFASLSIKVRVTAVYRHSLFVPLVSNILDGSDGATDGALRATVTEEMRVENPRLTTTGVPTC
jgi:Flp pilus assembly protein TadG